MCGGGWRACSTCAQTLPTLKSILNGNPLDAGFWTLASMGTFDPEPPRAALPELLSEKGIEMADLNSDAMNWASDDDNED